MRATTCSLIAVMAFSVSGCEFLRDMFFDRGQPFETPAPQPERQTRPVLVALEADAVLVGMDDTTQCLGAAGAAGRANGWTGTLAECPYPYTYEVVLAAGTLPGRVVLQEVIGPTIIDETVVPFRPLAVVTVTDAIGQSYRFESSAGF
ncbi:hypothetical protein BDE40_0457 [Litoreibacter halocynthiae]|uniref:Lipoprotein n=2 Tax=Litoreibacter TaxID=947567 RepID=A0A4R7LME1_9RHOB|nr:hypothetical protein [Litoreibacter]TDT77177.1 hypothetical protein BDE40_0457 [Litoreibacter halocynthiae]SHF81094.1 hypothetical protein SAMN05444273_11344 [Litoreibacter ascidiaceicola]